MKNKLFNIVLIVVFLAGLSLLLYPTVSNYYNSIHQSYAIREYAQQVDTLELSAYQSLLQDAQLYNEALAQERHYAIPTGYEDKYLSMLNTGNGVMAYVEIPAIEVTLPIMHTTEDPVLEKAAGHLEWSSLPIGGENTHCVISGHRGLPSAELFTNLDLMEVGDVFHIHVLGQTLSYLVDNIAVVLPNDYSLLGITDGQDYVTLLTCTPYGVNSHRLLVRGARMESAQDHAPALTIRNEIEQVDMMVLLPILLVILSAAVFVILALTGNKKRKKHTGKGNNYEKT